MGILSTRGQAPMTLSDAEEFVAYEAANGEASWIMRTLQRWVSHVCANGCTGASNGHPCTHRS